jgi:hypothetical protein
MLNLQFQNRSTDNDERCTGCDIISSAYVKIFI